MADAYYEPLGGDRFRATEHTVGPWDPHAEHGGPPAALLGRQLERCEPRPGWLLARTTVEILGPVPVAELRARARLARPGRSVELLEAELSAGDRVVARARSWRIRQDPALPGLPAPPPQQSGQPQQPQQSGQSGRPAEPPEPPESPGLPWFPGPHEVATTAVPDEWAAGYLAAMEWRFARGGLGEPGPATVWARPRHRLLPGEEISPVQRVLLVADSGNGVSGELDLSSWYFINPELTVHLHRAPQGEWLCLRARTTLGPQGVGLAESLIGDERGPVGRAAQALLVAPR